MRLPDFNLSIKLFMLTMLIAAVSCKKFLSEYSQNQTYLKTVDDLEELLVGQAYMDGTYFFSKVGNPDWLHVMDDDVDLNPPQIYSASNLTEGGMFQSVYKWQRNPYVLMTGSSWQDNKDVALWGNYYKRISVLNTIISFINENKLDDPKIGRLSGEAYFLRAYYYFMLVNIYGKPYNPATADTDFGVPLKTDPAIESKQFSRATVKQVYDQIINDLVAAEKNLASENLQTNIRANQAAAQALLSRVCLFMQDYEKAITYADKAMSSHHNLTNYQNLAENQKPLEKTSAEIIFCYSLQVTNFNFYNASMPLNNNQGAKIDIFKVSDDLMRTYNSKDLRLKKYFVQQQSGHTVMRKSPNRPGFDPMFLIRLPEVLLNKAEALAITGKDAEAIATVQELRKNRFKTDEMEPVSFTGADLVAFIREERRRELCFETQRWFDLRRYGVNQKYPFAKSIRHISFTYNNDQKIVDGYYELGPYQQDQAAYIMPIPASEVELSGGLLNNEMRPERPLKQ